LQPNNKLNNNTSLVLQDLPFSTQEKTLTNSRSGFIKRDGVVLDHISQGMGRRLAGVLGLEREKVAKVISDFMPVREHFKDMIKIHQEYSISTKQYEVLALISPEVTVSFVKDGEVTKKLRPILGNWIEGRVKCGNFACVTNIEKEHINPKHQVIEINGEKILECNYCEQTDTIDKINKEHRFIYVGDEKN
jgi:aspartate carbamoyltransferase regulatory subunit